MSNASRAGRKEGAGDKAVGYGFTMQFRNNPLMGSKTCPGSREKQGARRGASGK